VTVGAAVDTRALAKLRSLSWLDQEQIKRLAEQAALIRAVRGNSIFAEGDESTRIYILLSGAAKLQLVENRGQRVLVGLLGPGEVFGLTSLLPQTTRGFRCEALTDCMAAAVRPETFVDTVLGVPLERASRMLEMTVGRWWSMILRYSSFVGMGLRERLAGALVEIASKFSVQDARGTLLTLRLTHADLAELVGASRQRTTEQLIEFEREGMIIRDGRRLIIVSGKMAEVVQPLAAAG
jgi:CRP-like cAMP-binding protein